MGGDMPVSAMEEVVVWGAELEIAALAAAADVEKPGNTVAAVDRVLLAAFMPLAMAVECRVKAEAPGLRCEVRRARALAA
jgi:hypothetical protein